MPSCTTSIHARLPLGLVAMTEAAVMVAALHVLPWLAWDSLDELHDMNARTSLSGSLVFASLGVVSLLAVGLYSPRQRNDVSGVVIRIGVAYATAVALSAVLYYLLPEISFGRRSLLLAAGLAGFCSVTLRVWAPLLFNDRLFKRRVLVFGAGRRAAAILDLRRRADTRGFDMVAFVPAEGDDIVIPPERQVRRPADIFVWSQTNGIDVVVLAMDDRRREFPLEELLECRLSGIDVIELPEFMERETGKVRVDVLHASWLVLGAGFEDSGLQSFLVRVFDVLMSLGLLILFSPVMLLTAVAIWLEDGPRTSVVYRQTRVGLYNQPFDLLKFRSMIEHAEPDGPKWAIPEDPRVTRVGAVIRRLRIDELLQLFNVLRGEMSFVGPRPERPSYVEEFVRSIPYYRCRHAVKPGITGWAQLCYPYGASEQDAREKLQYDLYYVKHRSLIFDLSIVLQTVEVVLWGKGAR